MTQRTSNGNRGGKKPSTSWLDHPWLRGALLVLAVVLTYLPLWHAGFVWDDDDQLAANPCIVGPQGLKEIWTTSAARFFPLTLTTFWVEHKLWGLNAPLYHFSSVLMHAASAVVLWRVLLLLNVRAAWFGAALWALHPVQVESVAWIAETKNTQSGLFFLLSILFLARGIRHEARGSFALMFLFAVLAMASKTSTVVLPLVLVLCAWWMEGRVRLARLTVISPVFGLVAIAAVLTTMAIGVENPLAPPIVRPWPERLAAAGDAIWFYLGKLAWPHPLMAVYPKWHGDTASALTYLPLITAIIALAVLWWFRNGPARPVFFAYLYFLVALLPVLGLVNHNFLIYSHVADHLQYLASMGPLALAAAGLATGAAMLPEGAALALAIVLAFISSERSRVYQGQEPLWTDEVAKNDQSPSSYYNLGTILLLHGQIDDAITDFRHAITIDSSFGPAQFNLGHALLMQGQAEAAEEPIRRTIELAPYYAPGYLNLGIIYLKRAQYDEAIAEFDKALTRNPNYPEAHNDYGTALVSLNRLDDAIVHFKRALELKPDYASASYNLGHTLLQQGKAAEAIPPLEKALLLNPGNTKAQRDLDRARDQTGTSVR